jgi:hypothetical protein
MANGWIAGKKHMTFIRINLQISQSLIINCLAKEILAKSSNPSPSQLTTRLLSRLLPDHVSGSSSDNPWDQMQKESEK